jgi:hypothetical protein
MVMFQDYKRHFIKDEGVKLHTKLSESKLHAGR